jgi:LysR family hydrogen peroxide-inducible transcriptional activator
MSLPTVKQIQYFLALAEHEHFGRAAAASFVSQSAFSAAIKELEATLGVQLVDRTNRSVTVTAMGQRIAAQARHCVEALEELVEIAHGQRNPLEGELRLGVIPTIAPFVLPTLLPSLRQRYPKLRALLTEAQTVPLHESLLNGELDVLLLALPFELRGTETKALFDDRFLLAFREGTALIDAGRYRLESVPAETVLLLGEGHCLRGHALEACRLRGTDKLSPVSATSLLTLVEMVDADLGITFLPEMAVGSTLLAHTQLRLQPIPGGGERTIGLAWRKGSARVAEFALLGEFIAAHAGRNST